MSAAATLAGAAPGAAPDWHAINWRKLWRNVRRLQARIVKALHERRWGKVQALVYLLTHSFSGRAAAVERVAGNSGAHTPGVDDVVWDTPEAKGEAITRLRRHGYRPRPLRRVYIPKSDGKKRPLGIPTLHDRAMQALYLLALDPINEVQADPNSYGFRLERSCADALAQGFIVLARHYNASWVLEGDIKSCFDEISHDWLLAQVPLDQGLLRKWLKAGFLEDHTFHATTAGTPQGGIISPALANRTLDGLERLLDEQFAATAAQRRTNKVHLVRYADDFIITGTSPELLRYEVQPLVEQFLRPRGLQLSHGKTSITHVTQGFDFLGQHLRCYGTKLLLKPSRKNVAAFLAKVRQTLQEHGGSATAGELIRRLNPLIRGWASYHRHASSKRTYTHVDNVIYRLLWRWARRRHAGKSRRWTWQRYFTRCGERGWTFYGDGVTADGERLRCYLERASWTPIVRHVKIRSDTNPYDPRDELYLEERWQRRSCGELTSRGRVRLLWVRQQGRCRHCGERLTLETGWHVHHRVWRVYGGDDLPYNLELLHPNCHRQVHSGSTSGRARVSSEAFGEA